MLSHYDERRDPMARRRWRKTDVGREPTDFGWNASVEDNCRHLVRLAVYEDLGRGQDWTTLALVPHGRTGTADVVARQAGIVAGRPVLDVAWDEVDVDVESQWYVDDGDTISTGEALVTLTGPARDLITCERLMLNLLGRLCGIATTTHRFVQAAQGTGARVLDTRKTTPGWRALEKYAVRCGGGTSHRHGLFDGILIKDNHLAVMGQPCANERQSPAEAVRKARRFLAEASDQATELGPGPLPIEVEIDHLEELSDVLDARPDIVLLDNFAAEDLVRAVKQRDQVAPGVQLEASGGIDRETVARIARTGVDRISIGALTHSASWLDVGLDWRTNEIAGGGR